MRELADTIQFYVLASCAIGFAAIAVVVFVRLAYGAWCAWRLLPHAAALSIMAAWSLYVGGVKPPKAYISWDEGLYDAGSEVDTNDLRRITFRWRYDTWIPPFSTVTVSALPIGSSNSFEVASAPVTNLALTARMDLEATNYTYLVTHSYVPDPGIVTNGVYHVECFANERRTWVPKGMATYVDGRPVSYETNAVPPTLGSGGVESAIYILEEMK